MELGVWTKANRCECSACVEVMHVGDQVQVRQSQNPGGPVLTYSRDEWETFVAGAKSGDFDI